MRYLAHLLLIGLFVSSYEPVAWVAVAATENKTKQLPEGKQLADYDLQLSADKVAGSVHTWMINDGSLPPGLSLDAATGRIGGRPKLGGAYLFATQLLGASKNIVDISDWSITVQNRTNVAADFDYDGDVDDDDRRAFVLSYTGSRPEPTAIELDTVKQPAHLIAPTEDV